MLDLKSISPIFSAKIVGVVTIMVFSSACAHELFIRPANNDSAGQEVGQVTPEPAAPAQVSPLSQQAKAPAKAKHAKRIAKHSRKAHKNLNIAHNSHKHKMNHTAAATVASNTLPPAPPAPAASPVAPAPEIAPAQIPAPLASAGVQTEIDGDSGSHIGMFVIYGVAALALLGLFYVAPRARRATKPKRKLVYNG